MGDQGASLVEDRCGAMWSWALGVDEGAEAIELKIGREHAGHFALQGRSHSNYWCAKIEGKIRLGDKGPARFHGLGVPRPRRSIVAVFPEIDFVDFAALPILEHPAHRQLACRRGP